MSSQEQIIYLTEAEKIFTAFDNVPNELFITKNRISKVASLEKQKEVLINDINKINKVLKELYIYKFSR